MNYIQQYIDSIEVENSAKVARHVLGDLDIDIEYYVRKDFEDLILGLSPNSPKAIVTMCYVLGQYAKWLCENGLANERIVNEIHAIDKKALWKRAKPNAKKKFISYDEYLTALHDIEMYEEFNALYYATLFKCIFEGVYNDDMSVIKNLRASDIKGNVLTLREDNGHTYKFEVSEGLAADLKELAAIDIWERRNPYGICRVSMKGIYADSVFKVEYRKTKTQKVTTDGSLRFTYYSKLRKISDEHLSHKILPLQLYASGLMYRIKCKLNQHGITLAQAFAPNARNRIAFEIISEEINRCNNIIEIGNFREMVKGHIDSF